MKHKWKSIWLNWLGDLMCSVCNEHAFANCDPIDADKTEKFVLKTFGRNDCPGIKRKSKIGV